MLFSARRSDDADVIRARLRALLAANQQPGGWVPADDPRDDAGPADWSDDDESDDADDAEEGGPAPGEHGNDPPVAARPAPRPSALPVGVGRHRIPGVTARLDPGRRGSWALWIAGLLAAAVVVGWTWIDRPGVEPVPVESISGPAPSSAAPSRGPRAAPTPSPATTASGSVVVSVVGLVASPGLVTLPAGSRVADALAAVGGLLPTADPSAVNAAALLTDGQQIAVGVPGAPPQAAGASGSAAVGGLLNLNSATVADLDGLPGIGPVLAQRIIDHRTAHGPFTSVEQLDDVSGIGPAIYAALSQRVTV